jgi:Domain of unknown function (DUF4397)/Secretion system C-terminal sorting domain
MKLTSTLALLLLSFIAIAQPTNDSPCNAEIIEVDGAFTEGNNTDATADANEAVPPAAAVGNSCITSWCNDDVAVQNSMWYSFVAPSNGAVVISTCNTGSVLDTQIALWTAADCADYSTFSPIAANDDIDGGCTGGGIYSSGITIDGLTPGATYFIQVDGWSGEAGPFVLSVVTGQPSSLVNFIHTSADAALAMMDVRLDGSLILDNFSFLTCSQFIPVDASGTHTLSVHPPTSMDGDAPPMSMEINLNSSLNYEIAFTGLISETGYAPLQPLQILLFENALQYSTTPGSIPIHFLHASTDAPIVDFVSAESTTTLCNDLTYGSFNTEGYGSFAENFTLSVQDATGNPLGVSYCVPAAFAVDFGIGYTIAAAGFLNPGNNSDGSALGVYLVDWTTGALIPLEQGDCLFPDNDNLCTATTLIINDAPTMADNSFATTEANEAMPVNLAGNDPESDCLNAWCDGTLDNTLWFEFVAGPSGCVAISTCFQDGIIDTQIALCSADDCTDPSSISYLAANDDMAATCSGNSYSSELSYCGLIPGSTYFIQTDGYDGELGVFYIQVTEPLNVLESAFKSLSAYPNPANDRIFIQQLAAGSAIEIMSITGESVYNGTYRPEGIDITALASGNYVIRESESGSVTRFVKL